MGLSPGAISLVNTLLMAVTMGLVGVLSGAVAEIDSQTLPLLVVPGLAAAMFGRLTSFGITYIAGMLIGMAESILLYLSTQSWFPTNGGAGNPLLASKSCLSSWSSFSQSSCAQARSPAEATW